MIKIYHHSWVEKSMRSHKLLKRVAMNEPHRILKLWLIGKGRDVIEVLSMELPVVTISVPCYWGIGKKWPPDGRVRRLCLGNGRSCARRR